MKVIIVGTAYPLRGAMAHMNAILGWHLSKKHDVEIVSFSRQYPKILFPGKTQIDPGKPLFNLPTRPLVDSVNPLTWLRAARYIATRNPDLVVIRYWMPFFAPCIGVISSLVKRWTKAKVMFICDNIVPHEKRPGDEALTKFAFRSVDYFMILSKSVEADLKRLIPHARYKLSPHPIYDVFGKLVPKSRAQKGLGLAGSPVALFFGYVRRYKGLHTLLEALPVVLKKIPLKLLIVGEFYEDEQKYRKQIRELGLEGIVIVRPEYVPNEDVAKYFSACDVVVLPYVSATQSGIVQIAYHFDKPVIATDVGGLSEVVLDGKTGFIVPPEDHNALARAIIAFYREKRERKFAANIRKEKEKYSWTRFVKALEELVSSDVRSKK